MVREKAQVSLSKLRSSSLGYLECTPGLGDGSPLDGTEGRALATVEMGDRAGGSEIVHKMNKARYTETTKKVSEAKKNGHKTSQ